MEVENNELITINFTKEQVIDYLKNKLEINDNILIKNIRKEEIDGLALILIILFKYPYEKLKREYITKISSKIDRQIYKINEDKKTNDFSSKNINELWKNLGDTLEDLKIGEKLKYMKDLIIEDPPPEFNEMNNYIKKIFLEDSKKIIQNYEDLITKDMEKINERCKEHDMEINSDYTFILKLIIKKINEKNKNKENNNISLENNKQDELNTNQSQYLFYCLVEVYEYETSENDISYGLKNPIDEFKKLCYDLNIKSLNDCSYIDFSKAQTIELSSYMIWGSKESLELFIKNNNFFEEFNNYMETSRNKDKQGIYLCLNTNKNIAYIIIYPGKFSYKYSKISEPNDRILLTLIRYGFSISSNSILCLTNEEINTFDIEGYKIFKEKEETNFRTERSRLETNETVQKIFKIIKTSILEDSNKFQNKEIIELRLNNNNLLVSEELKDFVNSREINKVKLEDFLIRIESGFDLYFEENFDIPIKKFYLLIKNNKIYLENNQNDECLIEEQLKDILENKINNELKIIFKEIFEKLLNENYFENIFKCQYCNKFKKENEKDLYIDSNNSYFHKECYQKNNINTNSFNFAILKIEVENYDLFLKIKSNILEKNYEIIKNNEIINFFEGFERSIIEKKNISQEDKFLIKKEIERFKLKLFNKIYNNKERRNLIIGEEFRKYNELLCDNEGYTIKSKEWIEKWKNKINQHYNTNKKNIYNWTILKNSELIKNNNRSKDFEINLDYEIKQKIDKKVIVNLYKFMAYNLDTDIIILSNPEELDKIDKIENYYQVGKKGFFIYLNKDNKYKINISDKKFIEFFGLP